MAIGSRSQSARTYLERNLEAFKETTLEELLKHGMRALRDTLPNDVNLTSKVLHIFVEILELIITCIYFLECINCCCWQRSVI
jgi:20S proteasome alpha/beta subunit